MTVIINRERYAELLSKYQPRIIKTEEENDVFLAIVEELALLNLGMNCPHPQPFSLGRREPDLLFPLLLGEG